MQFDPSQDVWLTGDLTNNNTETDILFDKQTRHESRLMSVDLHLKTFVYWCLSTVKVKYFLMFIRVYFIL